MGLFLDARCAKVGAAVLACGAERAAPVPMLAHEPAPLVDETPP